MVIGEFMNWVGQNSLEIIVFGLGIYGCFKLYKYWNGRQKHSQNAINGTDDAPPLEEASSKLHSDKKTELNDRRKTE